MVDPVRAVVLSGGGADGAYEVGVLKALINGRSPANGFSALDPDIFTGTSIGSFNCSFLVSQWHQFGLASIGNLESVWLDRLASTASDCGNGAYRLRANPLDLLNPGCLIDDPLNLLRRFAVDSAEVGWEGIRRFAHLFSDYDSGLERVVELFNFSSFISREPWQRTIRDTIDFEAIRRSEKVLRIIATNWATGELKIFENFEMSDTLGQRAIEASSAVPGFFPPADVGSQPFVDGSVLLNTPLTPAIHAGGTEIYIVYLDPDIRSLPLADEENTLETLYRMQQIGWASSVKSDLDAARRINEVLRFVGREATSREPTDSALRQFVQRYARFKPLVVHRFFPREALSGTLGLLNLKKERLEFLIRRGFEDAVEHDCERSGCLLVDRSAISPETTRSL